MSASLLRASGLVVALLIMVITPVHAQSTRPSDVDIDDLSLVGLLELKVATTKTSTSVEETPAAVTVITRKQIEDWQYTSVADVLSHVTGFYVIDDHSIPNVGVRGMAGGFSDQSGTIKVMIDSVPVTFHPTGGNWLGPELIPLTAVERIEIVRGPTSSLYGADAFLAVVNIITSHAHIMRGARFSLSSSISDAGRIGYDGDATVGAPWGPFDILVGARYNAQDRSGVLIPESSPAPMLAAGTDLSTEAELDQRSLSTFARLTYVGRRYYRVHLIGRYAQLERTDDLGSWLQLSNRSDDPNVVASRVSLNQASATLALEWDPSRELGVTAKATAFYDAPTDRDQVDIGSEAYWVRPSFESQGVSSSVEARWHAHSALQIVGGMELQTDREVPLTPTRVSKLELGDILPGDVLAEENAEAKTLNNYGALVQAVWTPLDPLSLTAGLRYDHHSIYGAQPSGRASAVWQPTSGLYLKLMGGTAFKAPSPLLLYEQPLGPGGVIGNADLEPQRLTNTEGQVLYKFSDWLSASSGLSYNVLSDKAQFALVGINHEARNLSEARSWSWENRVDLSARGIEGFVSLERVWAEQRHNEVGYVATLLGSENPVYPDYIARAGALAKLFDLPLQLMVHATVVSERLSSADNALEAGQRYSLPAYALFDAGISTVGLELFGYRETRIALTARNLTDTSVADPGFGGIDYPLQLRTVFLQLRQEL